MERNEFMKKLICLILSLMLILSCIPAALCQQPAPGGETETPVYSACSDTKFFIRLEADVNSRKVQNVSPHEKIYVYEYGPDWCRISLRNARGYCKTKWLHRFFPLDPMVATVPGAMLQAGIARVTMPIRIKTGGYGGNELAAGDVLSVLRWEDGEATVNMMRETASIPAGHLIFTPFVSWRDAKEGDIIGGFTTYYNDETGGSLSQNRQFNIELVASRVTGAVVPAGELFSFKALSGETSRKNGYLMAPNISQDGKGYGGGVCQLTTTLFNAALGLPLKIETWKTHQNSGVSYVPRDFDAAISSYNDFIFRNLLPYPIRIEALPQHGVLTVIITRAAP